MTPGDRTRIELSRRLQMLSATNANAECDCGKHHLQEWEVPFEQLQRPNSGKMAFATMAEAVCDGVV